MGYEGRISGDLFLSGQLKNRHLFRWEMTFFGQGGNIQELAF